jgi:hypothetical protein
MKMRIPAFLLFLGLVAADGISVQVFESENCSGNQLDTAASVGGSLHEASACIPTNNFASVNVTQINKGYQCNLYSDTSCQQFFESAIAPGCLSTILFGRGIICFSQQLFENPFAKSTTTVTIGGLTTQGDRGGACDPTNQSHDGNEHFNHDPNKCKLTTSLSGSFPNAVQREYMRDILSQAMDKATQGPITDLKSSPENNNVVFFPPTFGKIEVKDETGALQASLEARLSLGGCDKDKATDCGGIETKLAAAALGAVPRAGGLLAAAFKVVACA